MKKHLRYYKSCMKANSMPYIGLRNAASVDIIDRVLLQVMTPTGNDVTDLISEGCNVVFWGAGIPGGDNHITEFTPLRQTIVLFMAAMNNEL